MPDESPIIEYHATGLAAAGEAVLCFIALPVCALAAAGGWINLQRASVVLALLYALVAIFCATVFLRCLMRLFTGSLRFTLSGEGLSYHGAAGVTYMPWGEIRSVGRLRSEDEGGLDTLVLSYQPAHAEGAETLKVNAAHMRPTLEELVRAIERGSGLREQTP